MGPLAAAGIQAGASILQGIMAGNQAKKDRKEQARQFDMGYGLQKGDQQFNQGIVNRQQGQENALAPGRQQILQALYQRMGIASPAVQQAGGRTTTNPGVQSMAGAGGAAPPPPGNGPQAPGFGSSLEAGSAERIRSLMQALGVGGGR